MVKRHVTVDGMETDLDLGDYQRFTGIQTTKVNVPTTGRIDKAVIDKERRGDYLWQNHPGGASHHRRDQAHQSAARQEIFTTTSRLPRLAVLLATSRMPSHWKLSQQSNWNWQQCRQCAPHLRALPQAAGQLKAQLPSTP